MVLKERALHCIYTIYKFRFGQSPSRDNPKRFFLSYLLARPWSEVIVTEQTQSGQHKLLWQIKYETAKLHFPIRVKKRNNERWTTNKTTPSSQVNTRLMNFAAFLTPPGRHKNELRRPNCMTTEQKKGTRRRRKGRSERR